MQIYNEKEQAEQGKIQNVQFEEKRSTREFNGAESSAQGVKMLFKESLMLNGIKGVVTSHPAKLPTCEKGIKEEFRSRCGGSCL